MEDLSGAVPLCLAKICVREKTAKEVSSNHNFMIICLMAGIQVVMLSVDIPRVRRSTWMANAAGRSRAAIANQETTSDPKLHNKKTIVLP